LKLAPLLGNIFKMLKYDFSDLLLISWRQPKGIRFLYIERFLVYPIFAFHVAFPAVDMHRLVSLVGIEEKSPPHQNKECRRARDTFWDSQSPK